MSNANSNAPNALPLSLVSANYESSSEEEFDVMETAEKEDCLQVVQETLTFIIGKILEGEMPAAQLRSCQTTKGSSFANFRSTKNEDEIDVSCDSSSDSSDSSSAESCEEDAVLTSPNVLKKIAPKTKGELGIDDLPPIENLSIQASVNDLVHIGRVNHVIDRLVSIQSFKNMPSLQLDSVLFLKDGNPLGAIFEVFGQVIEPRYLVRFNTPEDITNRLVTVDMPVYYAPSFEAPVTAYIFTEQLRKLKGTDASWKDNNEPPTEMKEYSDDEEERRDKMKNKSKRKNPGGGNKGNRSNGYASPSALVAPPNTPANSYHESRFTQFYQQK